jgi:hypothetical protein
VGADKEVSAPLYQVIVIRLGDPEMAMRRPRRVEGHPFAGRPLSRVRAVLDVLRTFGVRAFGRSF